MKLNPFSGTIKSEQTVAKGPWDDKLGRSSLRTLQAVIILAGVVILGLTLNFLLVVVVPIILALIFASSLEPLVKFFERFAKRGLAVVLALASSVLIFGGVGVGVYFSVRGQWAELATQATEGFDQLQNWLADQSFLEGHDLVAEATAWGTDFITSSSFGSGLASGLGAGANFVVGLVLTIVLMYYFMVDGRKIWSFIYSGARPANHPRWQKTGESVTRVLRGYTVGTATVAAADAVGIGLGLLLLGVPLALPLAVITFIFAFIPVIGATLAGLIAAAVALVANGPVNALLVIALVVLVNQLEGNFLQPLIMSRQLKTHALTILLGLAVGSIVAGFVGALLAVPVVVAIWEARKTWVESEPALLLASDNLTNPKLSK